MACISSWWSVFGHYDLLQLHEQLLEQVQIGCASIHFCLRVGCPGILMGYLSGSHKNAFQLTIPMFSVVCTFHASLIFIACSGL